ncbi:MAG: hypothetical protein ACYCXP_12500 [Leptospirillum sp.]
MFETIDELLKQIRLDEDSSLELKDLRDKGLQVNDPHRNSMADELAAMANTTNGVFVLGVALLRKRKDIGMASGVSLD